MLYYSYLVKYPNTLARCKISVPVFRYEVINNNDNDNKGIKSMFWLLHLMHQTQNILAVKMDTKCIYLLLAT